MGLSDYIPVTGSDSPADTPPENEPTTISRIFFVDETPWEKAPLDYRLILGPEDGSDEFRIYCCNDPTTVPQGTQLYLFKQGDVVTMADEPFQVVFAQLVQPEDVDDEDEWDGEFIDFPEHLAGRPIPERSPWSDSELEQLLLSIGISKLEFDE